MTAFGAIKGLISASIDMCCGYYDGKDDPRQGICPCTGCKYRDQDDCYFSLAAERVNEALPQLLFDKTSLTPDELQELTREVDSYHSTIKLLAKAKGLEDVSTRLCADLHFVAFGVAQDTVELVLSPTEYREQKSVLLRENFVNSYFLQRSRKFPFYQECHLMLVKRI